MTDGYGYSRNARFIEVRNLQVHQEMVLLSLLNQYFNITLRIPPKKASVYGQIAIVEMIWNKEMRIDFNNIIKQRCQERAQQDILIGVSEKTAERRKRSNSIRETLNVLTDMIRELGYFVETKESGGKRGTIKMEYITRIYLNHHLLYDEQTIRNLGYVLNNKLNHTHTIFGTIVVSQNNTKVNSILSLFN
ncbi:hypothetical protein EDI_348860 [Entamoeba dispar SAW760]|uniref:Uncharacterized protein n=1 Tax=Entamoeba dispar (strain ATCC PRA-260 / SAW760) TaxID=370354 RepID=B0E6I1_ENTDS|nr:uncharacterized protein EDI_348860 [Entamoeba dispar SAW760]EDR29876.1 hypothetical protein EDI_348860 [Entamoeba dispar SAW760]|eukprot:EDR29876.1 hypothetical protein EDI_348860 [Entamoeba dispar SAW760]